MTKVVTVLGARPQFIKAAPVSRALLKCGVEEVLVHTGQHYDIEMSEIFFQQMDLPEPHYNLGVGGGPHGAMTGRQLEKIEEVLLIEAPDLVVVFGDTNSTLAGGLAAAKLDIPVAHIEAGLRSFNRRMPEEVNRVLTDHLSTLLFSPTEAAVQNLANEGISGESVVLSGDVMYDATLLYGPKARMPVAFEDLDIPEAGFVLCTIHRAGNTDDVIKLQGILQGLADAGLPVVLPLHPRTRQAIEKYGVQVPPNVHLLPPVGYLEMMWLESRCSKVATDSGGIQKEAYFHRKPCITLREETEWIELVSEGHNTLAGSSPQAIAAAIRSEAAFDGRIGIYGQGRASELIASKILGCVT